MKAHIGVEGVFDDLPVPSGKRESTGSVNPDLTRTEAMRPRSRKEHSAKLVIVAGQVLLLLALAAPARAIDGPGGGLPVPNPPRVKDVICLTDCTALRTASTGSKVQISGSDMGLVRAVSFNAKGGRQRVAPDSVTETAVTAVVPEGALRGPIRVIAAGGAKSNQSPRPLGIGAKPPRESGAPRLLDAAASPARAYLFGLKQPTLEFVLGGVDRPTDLRIDLISKSSTVIASKFLPQVQPNQSIAYRWNGRDSARKAAPAGRYGFRVSTASGSPLAGAPSREAGALEFRLHGFVFPVPAPHTFGDGIGAGRNHQGADILADCGKPIIAARGGRVYWNDFQAGGAGNYIVINLTGTRNQSHVYMHLTERSRFGKGDLVKTGQRIGSVGTTGRSTACHLHFEHWSSPGWYQGGTFLDPMSQLKAWDRYS